MTIALWIAIYFVCWWLVLFTVLPIGVRTQEEEGEIIPGTTESAPHQPRLLFKLLLTTLISAAIFVAIYFVIENELIGLHDIPFLPEFRESVPGAR